MKSILVGVVFAVPLVCQAHIVPPEEFHPMAEAYRRMAFAVNLNPVPWDLVAADAAKVRAELAKAAAPDAEAYGARIDAILAGIREEVSSGALTPAARKAAAREMFELSTATVATAIGVHLSLAAEHLNDYDFALAAFDAARRISAAFEYEVKTADPRGYLVLGRAWLAAASALGNPGVAGVGTVPADIETFGTETSTIIRYMTENFGDDFAAPSEGRLVALPAKSPTFDSSAVVPAKLPPGSETNKQLPRPRQVLNMVVRGVDETETNLIALGDMAFDSPYIFGEPARTLQISCNTCHNKSITNPKFFVPGLSSVAGGMDVSNGFFAPHANNGHYDPVDIPDMRGIRFTPPYGRNGRFASLREFTRNVIVNEFNGKEPSPLLLDALIAYMNEFDFLPNPYLNPNGTLNEQVTAEARRGEKLFTTPFASMNNMSCATCHVPSNHFLDNQRHDIGSVGDSSAYSRDGAMDTPTLLSSLTTQPYFHDGSLPTLASVVDWFNEQYALGFSEQDRGDLTAYLETIGTGEEAYEDTMYTLEAELEEFSFFLSSYDYAMQMNEPEIASTIFQTVAAEIRAHKWDVQDTAHLPTLDKMAKLMDDAYTASTARDYTLCEARVEQYKRIYEANAEVLK